MAQPNYKRFSVRRIVGAGNLWVTEFILTYDGKPSYTVSIMEFKDGKVARETQYFGDPFPPGPSRAQWVERMSDADGPNADKHKVSAQTDADKIGGQSSPIGHQRT